MKQKWENKRADEPNLDRFGLNASTLVGGMNRRRSSSGQRAMKHSEEEERGLQRADEKRKGNKKKTPKTRAIQKKGQRPTRDEGGNRTKGQEK